MLDERGYLALPAAAAELVFQVLSERHERGSLIVTTNLPFGEWTKVFSDPCLAKAVVDPTDRELAAVHGSERELSDRPIVGSLASGMNAR